MIVYILTKNGIANRRLSARIKSMGFKYRCEKIDVGEYVYTVLDPDKEKWQMLKDMFGTDEKDFVFNEPEN